MHIFIAGYDTPGDRAKPAQGKVGGRLPARTHRHRGDGCSGRVQIGGQARPADATQVDT
ncbi:MAG: hypothetical protein OXC19_24775 [Bryobacterales bacterium]|nr:hypothetical protein [Bryobacterales bacterium]